MNLPFKTPRAPTGTAALAVIALLALSSSLSPTLWAASDLRSPQSRYTYNQRNAPVMDFARQFSTSFDLRLQIDPKVAKQRLQCTCAPGQPVAFLNAVAAQNGFEWQVAGDTLYIYAPQRQYLDFLLTDNEVRTPKQIARANNLPLSNVSFGDPSPDTKQFRLTAPAYLMELYRGTFTEAPSKEEAAAAKAPKESAEPKEPPKKAEEREFMVFRLKYASAADREYTIRDQKFTQPGVASTLQKLVRGTDNSFMSRVAEVRAPSIYEFRGRDSVLDGVVKNGPENLSVDPRVKEARENGETNPQDSHAAASIEAYQETNSVIVRDKPSKRAMYQSLITSLDVAPVQIEIRASIADVSYQKIKDWSSYLRVGAPGGGIELDNRTQRMIDAPLISEANNTPGMGLWSSSLLSAWITNLESTGDARVVAKPSVMTLDNNVAVLDLNNSAYVRLLGERVADLRTVTVGTLLKVTPRIVGNPAKPGTQAIHLTIEIEDGTLAQSIDPKVDQRSAKSVISTQTLLNGTDSVVIGGYGVDKYQKLNSDTPGLSRIPILGSLFKSDSKQETSRQRLFIITANIVKTGD